MDFVWDCYNLTSLKQSTGKRCGRGACKRITAKAIVPPNWQSFLRSNDYKRELFTFLAVHVESTHKEGKLLVSSCAEDILCSEPVDEDGLSPCNHEEADTRVFVRVVHAANSGHISAMIRTVDTDNVVPAVANMHNMQNVVGFWHKKVFQVYTMSLHCKPIQQDM